jgi:hypothetical protein
VRTQTFTKEWSASRSSFRATRGWTSSIRRVEQCSGRNSKTESSKKAWMAGGWTRPSRSTTRSRVSRLSLATVNLCATLTRCMSRRQCTRASVRLQIVNESSSSRALLSQDSKGMVLLHGQGISVRTGSLCSGRFLRD